MGPDTDNRRMQACMRSIWNDMSDQPQRYHSKGETLIEQDQAWM